MRSVTRLVNVHQRDDQARPLVIAADTNVDTSRFAGKPLYSTSTKQAMHSGKEVIVAALAQPVSGAAMSLSESVEHAKAERSRARTGPDGRG